MYNNYKYHNDRFIPFAGPFLLGALTGGVAISAFRPRPIYPIYYPGQMQYPVYY